MIQVAERIKQQYKSDDVRKSYLIAYRDLGIMQGNSDIVFDSPSITESVCSASNFKVGLCESSTASISVNLPENVEGDEMTIIQALGEFEPEITVDNTKGIVISGENVTLIKEGAFSGTEEVIGIGGETVTRYEYPETVNLTASYSDGGDLTLLKEYLFGSRNSGIAETIPNSEFIYPKQVNVIADYSNSEYGLLDSRQYSFGNNSGAVDETIDNVVPIYAKKVKITATYRASVGGSWTGSDGSVYTHVSATPIDEVSEYNGNADGFYQDIKTVRKEIMNFSRYDGTISWTNGLVQNISGTDREIRYIRPSSDCYFKEININVTYYSSECTFVRNFKYGNNSQWIGYQVTLSTGWALDCALVSWSADIDWSNEQKGGISGTSTRISIPVQSLGIDKWNASVTWTNEVVTAESGLTNSVLISPKELDLDNWAADVRWTDGDVSSRNGSSNTVIINSWSYETFIPDVFEPDKYYLIFAKIQYTSDEIYLYLETLNKSSRTVYYLLPDLELPKGYIQIVIPIIGSEFQQFKSIIYSKHTELSGYASVYEIGVPLMPLGLYGITSCKKRNESTIRDLQGYDRMKDANLSNDVHYNITGTEIAIGEILNRAASTTQIIIGSNLSKDSANVVEVQNSRVEEAVPNFPTGIIYSVSQTETANGSYSTSVSYKPYRYYTRDWKTVNYVQPTYEYQELYAQPDGSSYTGYNYFVPSGWELVQEVVELPTSPYDHVTIRHQTGSGYWPAAPSGYTYSYTSGDTRYYYRDTYTYYGFTWPEKYNDTTTWEVVSENHVQPDPTQHGTCTRMYRNKRTTGSWSETAIGTRVRYQIENYGQDAGRKYTVYVYSPNDYGAIPGEDTGVKAAFVDSRVSSGGTLTANRQSEVREAIYNYSTHEAVEIDENGVFEIKYVSSISYSGTDSGSLSFGTLFRGVESSLAQEMFDDELVGVANAQIHTTRRAVITSYLELNGLFIRFDRYGVSTLFKIRGNTLYPAEDLYPHDSTIPGLEEYGDIYPTEGAQEITVPSLCKEIYISDKINRQFDGVKISKSGNTEGDTVSWPFYFNRKNKNYGSVDPLMPEVGYWKGNYYYEISDNFFFNNFTFTQEQLIEICQAIMDNIGDLQYFNMTATIKALPYMEAGDNINIMTPGNGYETAILRRTMKGCSAMMDTFETEFYK